MYEKVTRQFRQCETSGMRNSNLVLGQNFFECLSPYYFYFIFFFLLGVFHIIDPTSQHVSVSSTVVLTSTFVV